MKEVIDCEESNKKKCIDDNEKQYTVNRLYDFKTNTCSNRYNYFRTAKRENITEDKLKQICNLTKKNTSINGKRKSINDKETKYVLYLRNGESCKDEWRKEYTMSSKYNGDDPLCSREGIFQALALNNLFKNVIFPKIIKLTKLDTLAIYSSMLARGMQTAKILLYGLDSVSSIYRTYYLNELVKPNGGNFTTRNNSDCYARFINDTFNGIGPEINTEKVLNCNDINRTFNRSDSKIGINIEQSGNACLVTSLDPINDKYSVLQNSKVYLDSINGYNELNMNSNLKELLNNKNYRILLFKSVDEPGFLHTIEYEAGQPMDMTFKYNDGLQKWGIEEIDKFINSNKTHEHVKKGMELHAINGKVITPNDTVEKIKTALNKRFKKGKLR